MFPASWCSRGEAALLQKFCVGAGWVQSAKVAQTFPEQQAMANPRPTTPMVTLRKCLPLKSIIAS